MLYREPHSRGSRLVVVTDLLLLAGLVEFSYGDAGLLESLSLSGSLALRSNMKVKRLQYRCGGTWLHGRLPKQNLLLKLLAIDVSFIDLPQLGERD